MVYKGDSISTSTTYLNSIFISQSKGILFADFKCVQFTLTGTPDVILIPHGMGQPTPASGLAESK